jgi:hypothetical protein
VFAKLDYSQSLDSFSCDPYSLPTIP